MDIQQIRDAATQQHIAPQALDTIVAKVQTRFAGETPRPVDITNYLASLPTWDKIGMDYAAFEKVHPNTRRDLHRTHNPTPPPAGAHPRRPVPGYVPSAEQQTELDAITNRDDKVTRYRQMRDQAAASGQQP